MLKLAKALKLKIYRNGVSTGISHGVYDEQNRNVRAVFKSRDRLCSCTEDECRTCVELNNLVAAIRDTDAWPDELDYRFGMRQENERVSYLIEANGSTIAKHFNRDNTKDAVGFLLKLIGEDVVDSFE